MPVISARVYVSRDEKKCFDCQNIIDPKEWYVNVFGSADHDQPFTSHWCLICGVTLLSEEQLDKISL